MMQPPQRKFPNLVGLGKITTPFGGQTKYEKFHPGIDIANAKGTPIKAPVSGQVVSAEGSKEAGDASYGNSAMIKDGQGNFHNFGHLDSTNVRPGQTITEGQTVGTMGNTGASYSPSGKGDGTHLDYRIVSAYGKYKNPKNYVNKLT